MELDSLDGYPLHGQQPVSLRQELGIMFGFLAACILTVAVYYIFWQARDEVRRKELRARGFHHERGGYHDKALHRYANRDPIAQTQGQTLEFLTEPAEFKTESGTRHNSEDGMSDTNTVITTTAVEKHMQDAATAGLRIDTDGNESWSGNSQSNTYQNGSAVSNRTPLSMMQASGGQSAKDMF
ncbi:hypothetical protein TSTA_053960 [Talaromyces stipitatus ATCC 10500]|uniref:Uncharacterized protein n=1 Tax=Talaromyces stipitatus (strain ATCC 10500 / CBS 375.48 / QM 6759 / NRRL 1006) TaxID=441959 RepID=B8MPZ4_TALSN|nr:uncharacterized protein TSTA_053960 [Talaromyces stipitatus ATCC 10500]EED12885.1 hypothetical protein TSTA_053960 [Talaromyces stipitatus ATCC 10500]